MSTILPDINRKKFFIQKYLYLKNCLFMSHALYTVIPYNVATMYSKKTAHMIKSVTKVTILQL